MRLVFDIEANGLYEDATKIWCICAKDIDTGEKYEWTWFEGAKGYGDIYPENDLAMFLADPFEVDLEELIGHNIINYDLPLLKKLIGWAPNETVKITDTLVMSRLGNPDRPKPPGYTGKSGPHGLDAWGYRVGESKLYNETWDVFHPDILRRCRTDVEINHLTYNLLRQELDLDNPESKWIEPLKLEHSLAAIITEQEHHGILFDKAKAEEYVQWLTDKIEEIDKHIIPLLPKELIKIGSVPINEPFLKTGGYRKQTVDYYESVFPAIPDIHVISGPFTRINFLDFDLGSIEKVKAYLLESGWIPDKWNYNKDTGELTSPKLEGNFDGVDGDIPKAVKERITWRHRRSQIEGWLNSLRPDGRLSAGANPCGTNTSRMRHHCVVNVPKANSDKKTKELIWDTSLQKDIFGTQMRSLFIAPEGYNFVGHDASGLELRMLAHYMNDPLYIDLILNGDIHEYNKEAAGLPSRDSAKTFIYALIYGAGDSKIGSIIGGSSGDGRDLKRSFFDTIPSLEKLIERVKRASGKGYLIGLDGRSLHMRRNSNGDIQRSRALNTLLQAGGAIVMKRSCKILWDDIAKTDIEAYKVLDMHDEGQSEVWIPDTELYSHLAVESIRKSGQYYNLNIPLDGEVKVGENWAATH